MKKEEAKRQAEDFSEYAKSYNVSFEEAVRDRDWPLSKKECLQIFMAKFDRWPSDKELAECRPDSQSQVDGHNNAIAQEMNNLYGSDNW